jgi:hypothetical protein
MKTQALASYNGHHFKQSKDSFIIRSTLIFIDL